MFAFIILIMHTTVGTLVVTPDVAILFPGEEVLFTCNTSEVLWQINGAFVSSDDYPAGVRLFNSSVLAVNMSDNATTYACAVLGEMSIITVSNIATLILPG